MVRATSIISQSGAGVSFEARVAATMLAAMLAETSGPGGEPADVVTRVEFQRSDPAAGFDDLHIHLRTPFEVQRLVVFQIKRSIRGQRSDEAFKRPVAEAALHLRDKIDEGIQFRIVASQSAVSPRDVDRARAAAILSKDGDDFWSRWNDPGGSSASERGYVSAIDWVVEQTVGERDRDLAWCVIARLGIAVLDVDQSESQVVALAVDRLQGILSSRDRGQALDLFETLCLFAEDAAKVSGGVDRRKILSHLSARYPMVVGPSCRASADRIRSDAEATLAGIRADIAGIRLPRKALLDGLIPFFEDVGALRLGGEAGSGKSAVLRELAERRHRAGDGLIVLRLDRLSERTWSGHADAMGVEAPLDALVSELAASGAGLLVFDGLDRIVDAGFGELVRELCEAIEASPSRGLWRCIVSSRDAVTPEPWLQYPVLSGLRPWTVAAPSADDLATLAAAFPHLAPLMARRGYAELNRNLFFIDQMARNPSMAGASSELDLMQAWAGRGAIEMPRHPSRDATLRLLGEARLQRPYVPLPKPADEHGLARLASERTVTIPRYRDVVSFGHDIYEDWAVARAMDARRSDIPAILLSAGQPLAWMRAVRLVAEIAVETDGARGWRSLHDLLRAEGLDPTWRRMTLTAVLYSPRAGAMLDLLESMLIDDDGLLMADLLDTLQTLDIRPHPIVLRSSLYDHLEPLERRHLAVRSSIPIITPWHAFLSWSTGRWRTWPRSLVLRLARIALTWLRVGPDSELATRSVMHCVNWLRDLDEINATAFDDWEERRRRLREMGADSAGSADPVGDLLRLVVAFGVGSAADEVDAYLAGLLAGGGRYASEFVETPGNIPDALPSRFVDLVVETMIMPHDQQRPLDYAVERHDGIRDGRRLFPASPTRAGFDQLFAANEDEALRLLEALNRAAAAAWRRREQQRGRTVRPMRLEWNGATFELWGDEHVYKWVAGLIGPRLLGSLYLAADAWMARELDGGRDIADLCLRILHSSHLVSSAALCVIAAKGRSKSDATVRKVLPLVLAPRLWGYDLRLCLDDRTGSGFGIGWQPHDEVAYRAADDVRSRRAAKLPMVEALVAAIHLVGDASTRLTLAQTAAAWTVEDLAACDEEMDDPDRLAELEEDLANCRAKADPENWEILPGPDEATLTVSYASPVESSGRVLEAQKRSESFERGAVLMEWAFGRGRGGATPCNQAVLEALPIAKSFDTPDLFEHALELDPAYMVISNGVAAVAAALAAQNDDGAVFAELDWLSSVFDRAAAIDYSASWMHFEDSSLDHDATASAARGLGALVMRGVASDDQRRLWLGMIASRFREVAAAALEPAYAFATRDPAVATVAFNVSAATMIHRWQPIGQGYDEQFATRNQDAINAGLAMLAVGATEGPAFPEQITDPFVGGNASNPCAGNPDTQFDHYRASSVWKALDVRSMCRSPSISTTLVRYLSGALVWYDSYLRHQEGHHGYRSRLPHWESTLGNLVGLLALEIRSQDAVTNLVLPAVAIGMPEARTAILSQMLETFGRSLVEHDREMNDAFEAIWRPVARAIFDSAHRERIRGHDPDEDPVAAAAFALYRRPVFPQSWPRAKELVSLIDEWVTRCAPYGFAAAIIKTVVVQADAAFLPDPALAWLEAVVTAHGKVRSKQRSTWTTPAAGELLVFLWFNCSEADRRANVVRFRAVAARLADRGDALAAELLPEIAMVQAGA